MRINFAPNVNFRSVTPIITKKNDFHNVKDVIDLLAPNDDYCITNATDLYKKHPSVGKLTNAVKEGKEVGFLITGKEYLNYIHFENDWASETAPTRHIDKKPVRFSNADIKDDDTLDKFSELIKRINEDAKKIDDGE